MKLGEGPCPKCGGNDWRREKIAGTEWTRARCRTCYAGIQRDRRKRFPHEALYSGASRRARESGIPFELELSDVRDILSSWTCAYCDQPVGSFTGGTKPNSATLDRLVSDLGYTPRNTVVACHKCNAAKADHTPASLRAWADRIEAVINRQNPAKENG